MTKTENINYNKAWIKRHGSETGRVYMVTNVVTGDSYIGSTVVPLKKRWYQMVAAANQGKTNKLSENIRAWGKECFDIEELYECSLGEKLKERENEFILEYLPSLNSNLAVQNKDIYNYLEY